MSTPQAILLAQIRSTQRLLSVPELSAVAVHRVRQGLKRGRGILRLMRPALAPRRFHTLDHCLRDVGRALRTARNETVIGDTLAAIARYRPYMQPVVRKVELLRKRQPPLHGPPRPTTPRALAEQLGNAARMLGPAVVDLSGERLRPKSLAETFRRGRRAWQKARREPAKAARHNCRRQATYLYYQMQLLRPRSAQVRRLLERARVLRAALGKERDLCLLRDHLRRIGASESAAGLSLRSIIKARRAVLRQRGFSAARKLFRHGSAHFVRALAAT